MPRKISFRTGITQIFILFTLLVAGAITFNFHRRVSDVVLELSEQITSNSAQRIIDNTRDFLGGPASYTAVVASYLENGGKQDTATEDHEALWQLMWGPLLITPQLQSLFYGDEAGSFVEVRRDPEFSTRVIDRGAANGGVAKEILVYRDQDYNRIAEKMEENDYDPRQRDWYKGVSLKDPVTWSGPFISTTFKTPLIAVSSPVLNSQGKARAVTGVNIPCYNLSRLLAEMPLASRSVMLAVDEEYRLIAHPLKGKLLGRDDTGNPKVNLMREIGPFYAALQEQLERNGATEGRRELLFEGAPFTVFLKRFPASFNKPGWRLLGLVPQPAPAPAEATFGDYAAQVFKYLEKPAEEVHGLATSFPENDSKVDVAKLRPELWPRLWNPLISLPQLQSFVIADAQGSYVQARREPALSTRLIDRSRTDVTPKERKIFRDENFQVLSDKTTETDFDPRIRSWYRSTQRGDRILWTQVYLSKASGVPVVSATHAVAHEDGSKAGVVSANIPLYRLSDFVAQAKVSEHGKTMILDRQGTVVAYPDKEQLLFQEAEGTPRLRLMHELTDPPMREAYRLLADTPDLRRFAFQQGEGRYIAVVQPFPESVGLRDWTILSVLPEADILGRVNAMLLESALLTAGIILLAVIAVYWVASAVARPINLLAKSIEGLRDFRLESIEGVYSRFSEVDNISQNILSARDGLASFQKYVPSELVRQLMRTRQSARLGGVETNLTILFTDVEGFTTISEALPADELMHHLSEYLDALSQIVLEEQGTIDKYIGDAIMAFWGAPEKVDHAPHRACLAALRCRERERDLNQRWAALGKPLMHTRFGIHCGPTVVGNVGSKERLNYTVVGDNVNLASRLEGINKYYGTYIIISEEVYQQVKRSFHCRVLDRVAVKGKSQGINIYELLGRGDRPLSPEVARFRARYQEGIEAYWAQQWDKAESLFRRMAESYPDDKSVALLLERTLHLQTQQGTTDQDWERTYVFEKK